MIDTPLLIAGLGNPGETYARHRHNVGFMAADAIAARHKFAPWRPRYRGLVTEGSLAGRKVLLLKPMTYMNESGRSVGEAARYLKLPLSAIVVIHDELDLAPGKLRAKTGGGDAGHNGLALDHGNPRPRLPAGTHRHRPSRCAGRAQLCAA